MAKVTFQQTNLSPLTIETEPHSNLMKTALKAGLPVGSSCGGQGICGKCVMQVLSGQEHLSRINGFERKFREKESLKNNERLSCQTQILGKVCVSTTYW